MERRRLRGSIQSRYISMSVWTSPRRLVELAGQSLLKDEALAIAALELLPRELFPPLFMAAFDGRHSQTLKAMVQAWPFTCLPLGVLMKGKQLHLETFKAMLDGLDVLLAQEVRPRRWKLQVLDLRKNSHQDFWTVWSGNRASLYSFPEPEAAQPMTKKRKVDGLSTEAEQPFIPVEVLVDLFLKEGACDELFSYLIEKVKRKKNVLHLCCKKLKIFAMPMQDIKMILKMVQLDSIEDLEVTCTWKLPTLAKFSPYLGQMINLRRLLLSHIHASSYISPEKEEQYIAQFTSQFLSLQCLQALYVDSLFFLRGRLDQLLRHVMNPLETLSITNCRLSEGDVMHLSQSPSVSQLSVLSLSGVVLTDVSPEPLQALLERASATLQDLVFDECGITDDQLLVLLPSLSHCSQLTTLSFCGNPISISALQSLLQHLIGLSNLTHVLYPVPLESYENVRGTLHLERLAYLHARLRELLCELGRPSMVWLSANPCPHCGDRTFYDPEPILCPCFMPN
ncbi:melanoma antigen preferentially expressed in tumors isoform X1 [Gorilla gorilla gorilla]|uniref:Preferentially expressed antigen in melanoma n=3 Tax=Gorilla gorilla gorilla TaxID=9595 RepID=G3R981_GORGO|nr:melanoma antigen preferentially expressed in tumors isoform X1 [Gorilla gorilla gorilla]XP_055231055.1 melanoma antigen preferentially expressed in tumors isoform X1 [Gorilla gorilla gorilla]XP_055231056.1 melanoma antigen preferentially expressed in tumors isoform X1 [Gorilla gorilla gorilla]XP_055231057.1 melanoma antigen preferentially expressed in tumors isoform X1 [Gorilla gorilla gorilla]XP_055231058.1 melanoma antigen preferentially expressed in tumors isoform X1 [Gorilla gorilla gori